MCCVHKLFSQHQKGRGDPAESVLAFHGVTSTSEAMCEARLGQGPFPPRPPVPTGLGDHRRPGETLSAETAWGPGRRHPSSQEASTSAPCDTPSPATLRGTRCSGAAHWPAWPSPYCLPEEAAGSGSRPLTQSQRPQGGFREPPAVPLDQAGVSQKWGPRRSESGCPWGHLGCLSMAASAGGSVRSSLSSGWTQVTAGGPVTRGVLSHPEPQDELAVRG